MRQKHGTQKPPAEKVIKDIRRRTRKQHSAEEKIHMVLEGLRGEESMTELCRREGIATSLYYSWSKECRHRRGFRQGGRPRGHRPSSGSCRSARDRAWRRRPALHGVNAVLIFPKSAEVKFPTTA